MPAGARIVKAVINRFSEPNGLPEVTSYADNRPPPHPAARQRCTHAEAGRGRPAAPGQTLTAGRDRRVYKALDKEHVLIETADFDKDHRQMPGYNAAKAKTFSDARVTFTEEQVRRECARCLGCGATKVDSYLCIGCGLCTTKCKFDAIHLKKVRDWHAGSYETMPIKVAEGVVKRAGSIVKKAVSK